MSELNLTSECLLALACVNELSLKRKTALLREVGDPAELATASDVVYKELNEERAKEFYSKLEKVEDIARRLEREEIEWVTYLDDSFPDELRGIADPPSVLFVKGSVSALSGNNIAIVGPRNPSRFGARAAQEFASAFAKAGLTVVSGFARGVDGIAHKACVAEHAPTVAVIGSGLDVCYPAEHLGLMDSVIKNGGAIISEYPLGTKPLQYHFPERNRIISGMSRAIFLAEAAIKSGSLITIRLAIEQGKDVFAVPGSIYQKECEGSNRLLREIPHALVLSPDDVLDALHIAHESTKAAPVEIDFSQSAIVEALKGGEKHFEELLTVTDLTVGELTNTLFELEMNGVIESVGSNYFSLA